MNKLQKATAAFVLSLLSGLWTLAASLMMYGFVWHEMEGWMGGRGPGRWAFCSGMMRDMAPGMWWPYFGTIAGIIVLVGAIVLYTKPEQTKSWGVVILIVSVLNVMLGTGGFLAALLGIIAGVLAITWRSQP